MTVTKVRYIVEIFIDLTYCYHRTYQKDIKLILGNLIIIIFKLIFIYYGIYCKLLLFSMLINDMYFYTIMFCYEINEHE